MDIVFVLLVGVLFVYAIYMGRSTPKKEVDDKAPTGWKKYQDTKPVDDSDKDR